MKALLQVFVLWSSELKFIALLKQY